MEWGHSHDTLAGAAQKAFRIQPSGDRRAPSARSRKPWRATLHSAVSALSSAGGAVPSFATAVDDAPLEMAARPAAARSRLREVRVRLASALGGRRPSRSPKTDVRSRLISRSRSPLPAPPAYEPCAPSKACCAVTEAAAVASSRTSWRAGSTEPHWCTSSRHARTPTGEETTRGAPATIGCWRLCWRAIRSACSCSAQAAPHRARAC